MGERNEREAKQEMGRGLELSIHPDETQRKTWTHREPDMQTVATYAHLMEGKKQVKAWANTRRNPAKAEKNSKPVSESGVQNKGISSVPLQSKIISGKSGR